MSDICHCAEPSPFTDHWTGQLYCGACRLWYDEDQWKTDPRVKRARGERPFTAKQQSLIDSIMAEGLKNQEGPQA